MSSLIHAIGTLFQPLFKAIGWLLAAIYGVVPNYAFAIAVLTIIIMGLLTPFTVKSTKSMVAMQRLQPEIKKLQQKYKGPENRQLLNEELMKLYRDAGANPVGGCLPVLLQAPFLAILYGVIKGLANSVVVNKVLIARPRYIPQSSRMYRDLVASHGQIKAFGMDLNLKVFSPHSSFWAQLPFILFVAAAVALQYFQMAQLNNRSRKAGQPVPAQQQTLQRIMPIAFAYFYIVIPAAVVLYMIISTGIRILTQDVMFRAGVTDPRKNGTKSTEKALPATEAPSNPGQGPSSASDGSKPKAPNNRSLNKRRRKDR
jgi:YidC/Oxa1 family membrane protein insertase